MYACMCTCGRMSTYICMYVYVCMHVCIRIYVCTSVHAFICTSVHTHMQRSDACSAADAKRPLLPPKQVSKRPPLPSTSVSLGTWGPTDAALKRSAFVLNRKRPPRLQRFALRHHHRGRAHRGVLARDTPCAHTRVRQISPGQTRDPPLATPPPAGVAPCSAWLWRGHHARTSHLAASAARSPRAAHTYAQVMRPRAVPSPRTARSRHMLRPFSHGKISESPRERFLEIGTTFVSQRRGLPKV